MDKLTNSLYLKFRNFRFKENVEYYFDYLNKGDLIGFKSGKTLKVLKHKKGSSMVTLEDKKEYDLNEIYDSIFMIVAIYDKDGKFSKLFTMYCIESVVRKITFYTKYHAYPETIAAFLHGDKNHYIYEYIKGQGGVGLLPNINVQEIEMWLLILVLLGYIKPKEANNKSIYYVARRDGRMYKKDFVFYVAYGSNLCRERLQCYITGKANKKYDIKEGPKCKDQTPIIGEQNIRIPYEMYFGNISKSWDNGGVCFIKPTKAESSHKYSFATAYLVTREQYEHIRDREGRSPNWYGKEIDLDPLFGVPTKTITSEVVHEYNAPCQRYIDVVKAGLMEWGLTYKYATRYIYAKTHK